MTSGATFLLCASSLPVAVSGTWAVVIGDAGHGQRWGHAEDGVSMRQGMRGPGHAPSVCVHSSLRGAALHYVLGTPHTLSCMSHVQAVPDSAMTETVTLFALPTTVTLSPCKYGVAGKLDPIRNAL